MIDQSPPASSAPAEKDCPAMTVFGVPELLEHILYLAVADQWLDNHSKLNFRPMPGCGKLSAGGVCLFRIQRVSRTFKDTIVGSPKLQQLMYLAPINHGEGQDAAKDETEQATEEGTEEESGFDYPEDMLPDHDPFSSLVDRIFGHQKTKMFHYNWFDAEYVCTDPLDGHKTLTMVLSTTYMLRLDYDGDSLYQKISRNIEPGWWNSEASWRQILISNTKCPVPLHVEIYNTSHDGIGPLDIKWKLPADSTLGHAFELFCELLHHIDRRRATVRAVNKKLTLEDDALEQGLRQERERMQREWNSRRMDLMKSHQNQREKCYHDLDSQWETRMLELQVAA